MVPHGWNNEFQGPHRPHSRNWGRVFDELTSILLIIGHMFQAQFLGHIGQQTG